MNGELIEITLGEYNSLGGMRIQSFNNDSQDDEVRNSFHSIVPSFKFYSKNGNKIPPNYRFSNVHHHSSNEIYTSKDKIIVGEYCDEGFVVPNTFSIAFNQLYNCSPLISLIKGDEEHLSFLHTWAEYDAGATVDKQVKHWMKTISQFGDVKETIFAPRVNNKYTDTKYKTAIYDMMRISQKTIVFKRSLNEISGIANKKGVYFNDCGYHLWEK